MFRDEVLELEQPLLEFACFLNVKTREDIRGHPTPTRSKVVRGHACEARDDVFQAAFQLQIAKSSLSVDAYACT